MRKAILMVVLAVVSNSAMAEWVKIGSGGGSTSYADPTTIRKNGNMVKMWSLSDYVTPTGRLSYMSSKTLDEYDCKEEQSRMLTSSVFSRNMGEGEVVFAGPGDLRWVPVAPGSEAKVLWNFACGNGDKKAEANSANVDAAKILDRLQPGWREIVNSTAFSNWMDTLPKDEKDKLNGSWEPYFISAKITEFNKSNEVVSNYLMEGWVKVSSTIFTGKNGVKGKEGRMLLSGEIRPGDAEIIALTLEKNTIVALKLNSMGGDVMEAMKIAQLIKGTHLMTSVTPGGFCASSCFFLFLAGESRDAASANDDGTLPQKLHARTGYVGIHRPYLKTPSGEGNQKDAMQQVKKYLVSEGVSQHLIDEMMSRPSNDIYWLPERDIDNLEINAGLEEALIAKCGFKRAPKRMSERWAKEQGDRLLECTTGYYREITLPESQQFLAKLRTGWRPWKKK